MMLKRIVSANESKTQVPPIENRAKKERKQSQIQEICLEVQA